MSINLLSTTANTWKCSGSNHYRGRLSGLCLEEKTFKNLSMIHNRQQIGKGNKRSKKVDGKTLFTAYEPR